MKTLTQTYDLARAREYFEDKMAFTTGPVELDRMIKSHDDLIVVDVRAAEDYQKGHIPGAINLPRDKWDTIEGLSKDKINVVYCYTQNCHLAATAALQFTARGYPVMELDGGFEEWKDHELETEREPVSRLAH